MIRPDDVLAFWLDETEQKNWFVQNDDVDAQITERFGAAWQSAAEGGHSLWLTYASGALAYILLTDQFSRNMFRGSGKAFSTDRAALAAAKSAIARKWDMRIDEPARYFFYLPLVHSENLCDQDRAVRLICERMPETGGECLPHARAHREVIRQFGRFPFRNDALDRPSSPAEVAFMERGGYGQVVRDLQVAAAA